jgi:hypothetical protein
MGKSPNEGMAETPDLPSSAVFQNGPTPIPMGETIPKPVMTTLDDIQRSAKGFALFIL